MTHVSDSASFGADNDTASSTVFGDGSGVASDGVDRSREASKSATEPVSIEKFLTDGSLARLCDEMTRLTGVPIWLRDLDGRVVVPRDGGKLWDLQKPAEGAQRAHQLVGLSLPRLETQHPDHPGGLDLFVAPLRTPDGVCGSIVMPADWRGDDPSGRRALERAVTLMASTASESIEGQLALRQRLDELGALYRLSSLLVRAPDANTMLNAALDLALDVLRLDAGSISMVDEQTGALVHRATRGLSEEWLSESTPLSIDGMLRERALHGDVVCVADLWHDDRIADPQRPQQENVISLIATGLSNAGSVAGGAGPSTGLIRLYSRTQREFTPAECGLLRSIADHAAMVIAMQRLRDLRAQDGHIRRQVRLAADVQRRMLSRSRPDNPRFDLAHLYEPSFQLGGDFYDLFEKSSHGRELGVAVGDVVGKGVPAAILMSAVRASLRAIVAEEWRLQEVIRKVNLAMCRDTLESEFVTLWAGIIDTDTLELSYCSAGHDPALLFRRPTGGSGGTPEILALGTEGMPVGIDPHETYEVKSIRLRAGDVLVTYTDGIGEAKDFDNQRFGRERVEAALVELLRSEPNAGAQRCVDHLVWHVRQFSGLKLAEDDITLVVVRVRDDDAPGTASGGAAGRGR